jgi:hypothetical protein
MFFDHVRRSLGQRVYSRQDIATGLVRNGTTVNYTRTRTPFTRNLSSTTVVIEHHYISLQVAHASASFSRSISGDGTIRRVTRPDSPGERNGRSAAVTPAASTSTSAGCTKKARLNTGDAVRGFTSPVVAGIWALKQVLADFRQVDNVRNICRAKNSRVSYSRQLVTIVDSGSSQQKEELRVLPHILYSCT